MEKSVDYMMHICSYFADDGADVGGEECGSVVPATREEVAHASAMRRLRQEAGDVEEAPLPEHEVVADEKVAGKPEHEVGGDVEVGEKKVAPGTSTRLFPVNVARAMAHSTCIECARPSFLAICKECQQYEHCAPGEPFWQRPAPQKTAGCTEQQ